MTDNKKYEIVGSDSILRRGDIVVRDNDGTFVVVGFDGKPVSLLQDSYLVIIRPLPEKRAENTAQVQAKIKIMQEKLMQIAQDSGDNVLRLRWMALGALMDCEMIGDSEASK